MSITRNIIEIKDLNAPELDIYARLNEKQLAHYYEPEDGLFIAESPKVIERAMNAGYEAVSFLLERKHIEGEAKNLIERTENIPIYTADFDILTKLTGFQLTRGAFCAMRRRSLPHAEELCKNARRIAVLENVVNPTNIGAIFRSAAALYIDAILLTPACSDPLYRRSARVSMGTVFQIPWTYMETGENEWPDAGMALLKKLGFKTAAMALSDRSVGIHDARLAQEEKLAIILGTEGDGLSEQTIEQADYTVKIPMSNNVDSLNVAAASAVAFWQLAGIHAAERKE